MEIYINGVKKEVDIGTKLSDLVESDDIILAFMNNKLCELYKEVLENANIEFLTTSSDMGNLAYKRGLTLVLIKAIENVFGKKMAHNINVMFSVSKGYYCEIKVENNKKLNEDLLVKIKNEMLKIVSEDLEIKKNVLSTDELIDLFANNKMFDKEKLFKYRRVSKSNIYELGGYKDYFYGYMPNRTGILKTFDLYLYGDGFVLQMPEKANPNVIPEFKPQKKLFEVLKESDKWGKMLSVATVGDLNDKISNGEINNIILVQEALQEKRIAEIASEILNSGKQIVLIAGPSSSGKTTFSHRLSIQLQANGLKPHPIPVDDYFVNREFTPLDEFGEVDFESLGAIDVEKFNNDMINLLNGKQVELPIFNFKTGKREYRGKKLKIGKNDVLVIEGIHGLNEELSYVLPKDKKFKIYISALTQLNIDEHNRIPTTDGRLIRRIVRDANHRGTSARETIAMWNSVRRGEEKNIFPFQEDADIMFNSALIYELAVLKQYAEPLLFAIPRNCKEFQEAKRLLKFLDYFLGVSTESIPKNSILREFIGESIFDV